MSTKIVSTYSSRAQEKKELSTLNDRFASYIGKIHYLQESNAGLEGQLKTWEAKTIPVPKEKFEGELAALRAQVDEISKAKAALEVERNSWQAQTEEWQGKCKAEIAVRTELKAELEKWKKELAAITAARVGFEKQLAIAQGDIEVLKASGAEEVVTLQGKLTQTLTLVEAPMTVGPDFSQSLREIREQYEAIGSANRKDAEAKYQQKVTEMTQQREQDIGALRAARAELAELHRKVDALKAEAESWKSKNGALEGSHKETEARLQAEIEGYRAQIRGLEAQIERMKVEMAQHLIEYQELMNIKMALDIEIAAYRKLLEGEEIRLMGVPVQQVQKAQPVQQVQKAQPVQQVQKPPAAPPVQEAPPAAPVEPDVPAE